MIQLLINKDMSNSCRECFRNRQCPQWNRRSLWKEEYIYKRSDNCPLREIKPQAGSEEQSMDEKLYDKLMSEYDKIYVKALASPYVKKPESYALYHLWKMWNAQEKPREVEE